MNLSVLALSFYCVASHICISQFSDCQDAEQEALCVGVRHEQFCGHSPPERPHCHRHQHQVAAAHNQLAGAANHFRSSGDDFEFICVSMYRT